MHSSINELTSFAGPLHSFAECLHVVAVQCHQLSQTTSARPTLPLVLLLFQSTRETKVVLPLHGELRCHSLSCSDPIFNQSAFDPLTAPLLQFQEDCTSVRRLHTHNFLFT